MTGYVPHWNWLWDWTRPNIAERYGAGLHVARIKWMCVDVFQLFCHATFIATFEPRVQYFERTRDSFERHVSISLDALISRHLYVKVLHHLATKHTIIPWPFADFFFADLKTPIIIHFILRVALVWRYWVQFRCFRIRITHNLARDAIEHLLSLWLWL